jgi:penicillin-insensitive murein endopeptidase
MSVGTPNAGRLVHGVRMPEGEHWVVLDPAAAYGTEETVTYLLDAIGVVHEQLPGGHRLAIGHISSARGGPLEPHKSHQSGRDVDIGYFHVGQVEEVEGRWHVATAKNLDCPRTWALVRALLEETTVEYLFIDTAVQRLLEAHARAIAEDPEWLDTVFQLRREAGVIPVIVHEPGHDDHIHIRFHNPVAEELGRRHRRAAL